MIEQVNEVFSNRKLLQVEQLGNHIIRLIFEDGIGIQIIGGNLTISYVNHAAVMEKLRELQISEASKRIVDYIDWID